MMTGKTRATPVLLWSRAALLGTVVVTVSAVGHVSADGLLPGPAALVALLLAATVVSARFLTHQASPLRLVTLLVAGQGAIHGALSVLAGHGSAGSAVTTSGAAYDGRVVERSGSHFDQVAVLHATAVEHLAATASGTTAGATTSGTAGPESAAAGWSHLVEHLAGQSPAMLVAHLAVVAVLGLWLAMGERALWSVLVLTTTRLHDLAARAVLLVLGQGSLAPHARVLRGPVLATRLRTVVPLPQLLHHVVVHRGPPALLAA